MKTVLKKVFKWVKNHAGEIIMVVDTVVEIIFG